MDELASLLLLASEGERQSVIKFLNAFKTATLIVPEKDQIPPITKLAKYPDRPLNILAIPENDITVVPVFSNLSLVEEWSARTLKTRTISTIGLIELLPNDWWLALNPGDEARKDFSPWELQKLLGNENELLEIATDLELEYSSQPLIVRKVAATELPEVKRLLTEILNSNGEILEIYLAIEEAKTVEDTAIETLLVGIRIRDLQKEQAEQVRLTVKSSLEPLLIGSLQLRVLLGVGFNDLELGIFADISPEIGRKA